MNDRNFRHMIEAQWAKGNSVCVGLDSEFSKIPESARVGGNECKIHEGNTIVAFNRPIVEATKDLVCAYKLNTAFYEAHGAEGIAALQRTISDIHFIAPEVPVILDAKRGDIGNTNAGYVDAAFGVLRADAITVNPYLGLEALQPFFDQANKGIFVLCRTSNPDGGEFQDQRISVSAKVFRDIETRLGHELAEGDVRLYEFVAHRVATERNKHGNCALVVGATYPADLQEVRKLVGDMPFLIPGIGAQGGDVEAIIKAAKDSRGQGMIVNSSRGIIFASKGADFAEAAHRETEKLHNLINQYR